MMEMYRRSVCKFLSTLQFDNPNKKKKFLHACKINKRLLSKMDQTSIDTHSGVTDSGAKKRKHNANFFPLKKLKAAEVMKINVQKTYLPNGNLFRHVTTQGCY